MKRILSLLLCLTCFLSVLTFITAPVADAYEEEVIHLEDLDSLDEKTLFTMEQVLALLHEAYDLGYEEGKSGSSSFSNTNKSIPPLTAAASKSTSPSSSSANYILNTNTKKFHYPSCSSVSQMKEKNKEYFSGTRDEAIAKGYVPCKNCNP